MVYIFLCDKYKFIYFNNKENEEKKKILEKIQDKVYLYFETNLKFRIWQKKRKEDSEIDKY